MKRIKKAGKVVNKTIESSHKKERKLKMIAVNAAEWKKREKANKHLVKQLEKIHFTLGRILEGKN